jgi:hypothetical protein
MSSRIILNGGEPGVGTFEVRLVGNDLHIFVVVGGVRKTRRVEYSKGAGMQNTYTILRQEGFTMSGFQSAKILPFNKGRKLRRIPGGIKP